MTNRIKIHLDKSFITKPLTSDTLLKVISSEHPSVLHRLYLIANELKETQYFMELDHDFYDCVAKIKTDYVYAGKARSQAEVISFMKPKLGRRVEYNIVFRIYEKVSQHVVFEFKHKTTNINDIVDTINTLERKTKEICLNKVDTY
jgi:hypothetical protein